MCTWALMTVETRPCATCMHISGMRSCLCLCLCWYTALTEFEQPLPVCWQHAVVRVHGHNLPPPRQAVSACVNIQKQYVTRKEEHKLQTILDNSHYKALGVSDSPSTKHMHKHIPVKSL